MWKIFRWDAANPYGSHIAEEGAFVIPFCKWLSAGVLDLADYTVAPLE